MLPRLLVPFATLVCRLDTGTIQTVEVCLQSSFASRDLSDLLPGYLSFRDYRNGEKEGILVSDWPCPIIGLGCDIQSLDLTVPTSYTSLQEQSYKEGV